MSNVFLSEGELMVLTNRVDNAFIMQEYLILS